MEIVVLLIAWILTLDVHPVTIFRTLFTLLTIQVKIYLEQKFQFAEFRLMDSTKKKRSSGNVFNHVETMESEIRRVRRRK